MGYLIFPILYLLFITFFVIKLVAKKSNENKFNWENILEKDYPIKDDYTFLSLEDRHNLEHDQKIIDQEAKISRYSDTSKPSQSLANIHDIEHDQRIENQRLKESMYSEIKNQTGLAEEIKIEEYKLEQARAIKKIIDDKVAEKTSEINIKDNIKRGVIYAEILSKPKSLRK